MDGRAILIVLLAILAVLVLLPALAMATMIGGMMGSAGIGSMMGQPGAMPWFGWLMMGLWLLVLLGLILLVVWAARRLGDRGGGPARETPLAILQQRYARGEIGPQEYERMHADLLRDRGER